jgi:hypothetical protein
MAALSTGAAGLHTYIHTANLLAAFRAGVAYRRAGCADLRMQGRAAHHEFGCGAAYLPAIHHQPEVRRFHMGSAHLETVVQCCLHAGAVTVHAFIDTLLHVGIDRGGLHVLFLFENDLKTACTASFEGFKHHSGQLFRGWKKAEKKPTRMDAWVVDRVASGLSLRSAGVLGVFADQLDEVPEGRILNRLAHPDSVPPCVIVDSKNEGLVIGRTGWRRPHYRRQIEETGSLDQPLQALGLILAQPVCLNRNRLAQAWKKSEAALSTELDTHCCLLKVRTLFRR